MLADEIIVETGELLELEKLLTYLKRMKLNCDYDLKARKVMEMR